MTIKTNQIEGSGASQLVQLIQTIGYNKDTDIELGTVKAAPPGIIVKLDNSPIELDKDDLIVAQWLTKHKRTATVTAINVTPADISSITLTDAEIEFTDELKVGDRVLVAAVGAGQRYIILDRAVEY